MIAAARKHWIAVLLAVVPALGLVSTLNVANAIGQPFGGFYADRNQSRNVWEVGGATPTWWPALAEGLVRYDDILLSLGNQPYGPATRNEYATLFKKGQPQAPLTLRRGGETIVISVPIRLFTFGNFLDLKLPDLLQGLGFWLLGLAVYRARPHEPVNRIFAITCSLVAGSVWVALASLFMEEPGGVTRALNFVWLLLVFPLGPVIIHLAVLFPEPARRFSPRRFAILYVLMGVVAVFFALSYLLRWQGASLDLAYSFSTFGYSLIYTVFGVGFFFYIARLNYLLWRPSRRTRRQARLMLGGLLCALPYVVIIILRALFANTPSYFWSGLDLRFLVLAVPLTFAYVILRYQTSQSTHPLLIDVFILAVSVLLASLGAWAFHLFTPAEADPLNNFSPFTLLFVAALISGFIWRRQSRWQAVLNRLFLPELRGYGAVWQFGRQVIGQTGLAQLPPAIAAALVAHLELERAAVWLWDETKKVYTLAGQAGDWKESPLNELIPDSTPIPHPVRLRDVEAMPDWLAPMRSRGSLEVVAPLSVSGRPIGLLGLGQRRDEEIFDERDLEILDLIAQQSALFLLTALQIEQLREVPLQVNAAQERERFTIAQELHDTVQQFLGRLPFYLQVSRDSLRADPAEAEALLQRCITDVESEAQTVRQIRNNLAPLQLEKSLIQPLRLLIEHFHSRTRLEPHLDFSPEVDLHLTLEARHALYRVVQQALDNISEHAQATQVTIIFKCEAGRIHFSITDNGRGFSEAEQAEAQDEGSFGLKSMQARITALGGEFSLRSAPGQGTQISGWLPVSSAFPLT